VFGGEKEPSDSKLKKDCPERKNLALCRLLASPVNPTKGGGGGVGEGGGGGGGGGGGPGKENGPDYRFGGGRGGLLRLNRGRGEGKDDFTKGKKSITKEKKTALCLARPFL